MKQTLCLLLVLTAHFVTSSPTPFEDDDDDEALIKELEQILKGQSTQEIESLKNASAKGPSNLSASYPSEVGGISSENFTYPAADKKGTGVFDDVCACKKYFECNVDKSVNDVGGGGFPSNNKAPPGMELDIRLGDTVGSQCGHYFDICCENIRDNVTDIRNPNYRHSICGKRNTNGVGFRIVGDVNEEAQFGEFPWMTAIISPERQEGKSPLNVFVCGGSLIHPRVVMTAAHCVYKKKAQDLVVRVGEWDTQTVDEVYRHSDHYVGKMIVHEDFYAGALYNDIALLILSDPVKLAPHIDTVCLPPKNFNFDGQRCFASGWGRDSFGKEGKYQVILKKLDLPLVSNDVCERSMRKTRLGNFFRLHESFVCAGGEKGKDTCRGDGGSPLVCKVPGSESYVQYGIVAWGIGCGEEGVPGVYVNVASFVPWITTKMLEGSFETKYFKLPRNAA